MQRYKITYTDEAKADVRQTMAWYEAVRPGLGEEFSTERKEQTKILTKHPKIYQIAYKNRRILNLNRFPYKVIYIINDEKNEIQIIAIMHDKQHELNWKNRN
jgi:plasmid stabilization system protein ParE